MMAIVSGLFTLLLIVIFLAIWAWAWSSKNKEVFAQMAELPLADKSKSTLTEVSYDE